MNLFNINIFKYKMLFYINKYNFIEILNEWLTQKDLIYLHTSTTNKKLFIYLNDKFQHIKHKLIINFKKPEYFSNVIIYNYNIIILKCLKWFNNSNIKIIHLKIIKNDYEYIDDNLNYIFLSELEYLFKNNILIIFEINAKINFDDDFCINILTLTNKYCKNLINLNISIIYNPTLFQYVIKNTQMLIVVVLLENIIIKNTITKLTIGSIVDFHFIFTHKHNKLLSKILNIENVTYFINNNLYGSLEKLNNISEHVKQLIISGDNYACKNTFTSLLKFKNLTNLTILDCEQLNKNIKKYIKVLPTYIIKLHIDCNLNVNYVLTNFPKLEYFRNSKKSYNKNNLFNCRKLMK